MNNTAKLLSPIISHDEKRLRAEAVRAGIASARIEGGDVGSEAQAIMNEWAEGLIDAETTMDRIDGLHVPQR